VRYVHRVQRIRGRSGEHDETCHVLMRVQFSQRIRRRSGSHEGTFYVLMREHFSNTVSGAALRCLGDLHGEM
jgi:hypothetical protein